MRLVTLQTAEGDRLAAQSDAAPAGEYVDLMGVDAGLPTSMRTLLAEPEGLARAAVAWQRGLSQGRYIAGALRAPIVDPGKILCIGLNYRDHAAESGLEVPSEPVVFSKFGNTIIGSEAAIQLPAVSTQVDFEAELVVVIGRRGRRIPRSKAFHYVAGYMNGHDVSARDWQIGRPGKQWLLGKTPDSFAPIGPWLVTADEIADPHDLSIELRLNGEVMQKGSTREFIFGIDDVIAHVSQLITLEPGDILFTGTPAGVGMGRRPPIFLQPGDIAEVEIEGLGVLRNPVEAGD